MKIVRKNIKEGIKVKEHPVKVDFSILIDRATVGAEYLTELVATIKPGFTLKPSHSHKDIEEITYVLEGKGAVWVEGEVLDIQEGDSVLFPTNSKHTTKNTGKGPLKILCFFSSPDYRAKGNYITHEDIDF